MSVTTTTPTPENPEYGTIRTLGRLLDDLERVRIMNGNRIGALERTFGSPLPHLVEVDNLVQAAEHLAELELVREWRRHPLAPWAKNVPGLGEKSVARLIAEIGDPANATEGEWHKLPDGDRQWVPTGTRERSVSELWSYVGLGDPARKLAKGMLADELLALGKPRAKKQCWLIGEAFVKVNRGPYREAYDRARERYADRVHAKACVRCGPSGKPAEAGSAWSLKHQHEAAKRFAVKQFLKDLWIASRQSSNGTHPPAAGGDSGVTTPTTGGTP